MKEQFEVEWNDSGREPRCPSNPEFPEGIDLNLVPSADVASCKCALPYPAKRCGYFILRCQLCGLSLAVTTAGRPDDPRSVTMPCKLGKAHRA